MENEIAIITPNARMPGEWYSSSLPPKLDDLASLHLDLDNSLTGRIIGLDLSVIFDSNLCGEEYMVFREPSLPSLDDLASLHLDLDVLSFTNGFPSFIRSFPNLTHLYLSSYEEPGMEIPQELRNLTRPETLEVTLYNTMYASTLSMLSRLSSLKRLVLNSVFLAEATDWLHVVSNLPRLEHLDLGQCFLPNVIHHSQLNNNSSKSLAYLDLSYNNLQSSPSWSWIFNHSSLMSLFMSNNLLNGSVHPGLGQLSMLRHLDISSNSLKGDLGISHLANLSSLRYFDISSNKLNGSVHPGLGQLSMLRHLDISSNSLKGDLGISHLANLSSLRYFDISSNSLNLNVGSSWVPPFHLDTIALASCGLGSRFPGWLRTQTNYSELDLSNTGIKDTIPFWFWNLSSAATFIILSHNRLHGKLPTDFPFVFDMNPAIDLSFNFLEGTIPSFFSNAGYLNLSRNSFSGSVSVLCQTRFAFGLDLSHNNLSGNLTDCISAFWERYVLDLSNNNFFGELPSSQGNVMLQSLHLRNNKFSGKLPLSLCNLTRLSYLDLGDNLFSGEIPGCLGNMLSHLTVLSLRNNSFSGSIPPELCHPSIQILDLSMNNISSVIPKCLCKLQAMTQKKSLPVVMYASNGTFSTIGAPYKDYISLVLKGYLYNDANHLELVKSLDLSGNNLRGGIPGEISCLTGLISLNFSGNNLSGSITSKIGSLKSLESLDLSNNHLSGEIPSTISDLNFLGTLNLANNNFSGRIPTGTQIQGFNASAFAGNPWLCGEPLPNKCPGDGDRKGPSINEDHQNPKDNNAFDLGLYISVVLGFITGFWAFCGVLVVKRSWRIAYFRVWIHVYDKLYVLVTLMLVRIRRRYLA